MKKSIYIFLLSVLCLGLFSCKDKPLELNVMSFNVRYDNPEDSLNSWSYRKDVASQTILNYDADIVGTQEVLSHQLADLKAALPGYTAVGVGREDGKEAGEYSALLYKKDRFKEVESGTFWLSETPEVAGSKGWDGACERVATWAFLEEIESGKRFFFINTHLDHVGKLARINGAKLMLEKATAIAGDLPMILTGDFNSEPSSDVVQYLLSETSTKVLVSAGDQAKEKKGNKGTFHSFGRIPLEKRPLIDYIFVSKGAEILSYEVIDDKLNDVFISDHNPLFSKIQIK
ncbi:endonuclease/exonuclease/phosphatase family protein [Dysgonomonas sp. Marseille-P4361]|uniref:endonuclease/exonuclease/phosphatase family protein n=1 Tax=Dysgonomonas sp. Marseille-P4361 TaxID=2161820 RepID=UPI000D55F824|nr:endonuclease/exonuclease/phosphatase family protein [Dysgonomonas sp. Marseille-P4361]